MDITDLAALDDDVGQVAQSGADEGVMHGAGGEQRGNGRVALVDAAVGEDQDAGPTSDGGFRLGGDSLDRFAECRPGRRSRPHLNLEQGRDRRRATPSAVRRLMASIVASSMAMLEIWSNRA